MIALAVVFGLIVAVTLALVLANYVRSDACDEKDVVINVSTAAAVPASRGAAPIVNVAAPHVNVSAPQVHIDQDPPTIIIHNTVDDSSE